MTVKPSLDDYRRVLKSLPPEQYQRIREAYYKVSSGLAELNTEFERANRNAKDDAGVTLVEFLIVGSTIERFNKSKLGDVL